jgi:hypothetical protein
MKINSAEMFIQKLEEYYGGFPTQTVCDMVSDIIGTVKPTDYDRLFMHLVTHYPATWKMDVKCVSDAIGALNLVLLNASTASKCPSCGGKMSNGICSDCQYTKNDGDPVQYHDFWLRWKAGKEPHYDVSKMMHVGVRVKR